MRVRRTLVGLLAAVASLAVTSRSEALSCMRLPLGHEALAADSVVEGTIAARRPVNQVLRTLMEWYGGPPSVQLDRYELLLEDVQLLRGAPTHTIRTPYESLEPGRRYVFIARQGFFGTMNVGLCRGHAIEASRSAGFREWLASLPYPAPGGRLFGNVGVLRPGPRGHAVVPIPGARVTARGPVVVEGLTDENGLFALAGLPNGAYEVSAAAGERPSEILAPWSTTVDLLGDRASEWVHLSVRAQR